MKKILAMLLSVAIIASIAIGGTVAYLSDQDGAVNTMTVGGVEIVQREWKRYDNVTDPAANTNTTTDTYLATILGGNYSETEPYVNDVALYPAVIDEDYAYDYQLLQWYRGSDIRENGAEKNSAPSVKHEAVNPYPDEYMYLRHPLKLRNYVDKMVSVTNVGESEAYIRTVIAIPSGGWTLEEFMGENSWLHWDADYDDKIGDNRPSFLTGDNCDANGWMWSEDGTEAWPTSISNLDVVTGTDGTGVEIDGVKYFIFTVTNKDALAPNRRTAPNLLGFYMDSKVDNDTVSGVKNWFYRNGSTTKPIDTFTNEDGKVQVMVVSQATQTLGFDDAWDALDAAFGEITEQNHPWKINVEPVAPTEQDGVYEISTAAQLFGFAEEVNKNGKSFEGKTVKLTTDIDLNYQEWDPISQTGNAAYFMGTFDGNNKTIKHLYIKAPKNGAAYANGFFGFIDRGDAEIKNLTIDGAEVSGHHYTGVVVGYLSGTLSGCTVKNATVTNTHANGEACGDKAGAVVGFVGVNATANNCKAVNCTVSGARDAGQVVGCCVAAGNVTDCTAENVTVTADTTNCDDDDRGNYIGDMVGHDYRT